MSKFFLLYEEFLLASQKNQTSVAAFDYLPLLTEKKIFTKK